MLEVYQNKDLDIMFHYIESLLYESTAATFDYNSVDERYKPLAQGLAFLGEKLNEIEQFSTALANGELNRSPGRDNPLAGPLKDLQANLRHLTWQALQVAKGDYQQKVDYMGEFSEAFNQMVEQLKKREELMAENARLETEAAETKNHLLEEMLEKQVNYYKQMTGVYDELRTYRHDMKNHFLGIESLLAAGKVDEARAYMAQITNQVFINKTMINSGNYMVDSLLSEKMALSKERGYAMECDINIRKDLKVENIDWCILLGNALDNAMEACARIEHGEKQIKVKMRTAGEMVTISIENSIAEQPVREGELFKTTKAEKVNHGLGMKNMKRVVEKYEGVMEAEAKKDSFELIITLFGV